MTKLVNRRYIQSCSEIATQQANWQVSETVEEFLLHRTRYQVFFTNVQIIESAMKYVRGET